MLWVAVLIVARVALVLPAVGEFAATLFLMHVDTQLGLAATSHLPPLDVGDMLIVGYLYWCKCWVITKHWRNTQMQVNTYTHTHVVSQFDFRRDIEASFTVSTFSIKRGKKDSHHKMTIKQESNQVCDMDSINAIVSGLSQLISSLFLGVEI